MLRYIARRIAYLVPVWLGISILAFALSILAPGDPVRQILQAGGIDAPSAEQGRALRQYLRLDDPPPGRYVRGLADAVPGEFGRSCSTAEPGRRGPPGGRR